MARRDAGSPPVTFEVGYDRFVAEAIAAECEADGRTVRLLTMDNAGQSPGLLALQPHRLLSSADDAGPVGQVVRRWMPDDGDIDPDHGRRLRPIASIIAVLLLTVIAVALASGLVSAVN